MIRLAVEVYHYKDVSKALVLMEQDFGARKEKRQLQRSLYICDVRVPG